MLRYTLSVLVAVCLIFSFVTAEEEPEYRGLRVKRFWGGWGMPFGGGWGGNFGGWNGGWGGWGGWGRGMWGGPWGGMWG